jgi:dihydropteroate synthase
MECRGFSLEFGKKTLVMGILNVTPDSFSDGGKFYSPQAALEHARQLINEGADILDIGAESTRPGHKEISADEEWSRLEPVLKELLKCSSVPISLDTQKVEVAEKRCISACI